MSINKPFRRTCRQLLDGSYANSGHGRYVGHPKYASAPEHYVRAFLILQQDLRTLFDYVEPADKNLPTYSYRIHELLMRACIEVEANCKAILQENGYSRAGDWNMGDYKKIELSHRLSEYRIRIPAWSGAAGMLQPFQPWATGGSLPWYQIYNATKHDRHKEFATATFDVMLNAICGCLVLLSSQFRNQDFSGRDGRLVISTLGDGSEEAIGGYFRVHYPTSWAPAERYDFDWQVLGLLPDPFDQFSYPP
jgi:hypothetical protein